MNSSYQLTPSTHLCELRSAFIILDASRDRYYRLGGDQYEWMCEILNASSSATLSEKAAVYAARLAELGLITKLRGAKPISRPSASLRDLDALELSSQPARVSDFLRVGKAHWTAARLKRATGLSEILRSANAWKEQAAIPEHRQSASVQQRARVFEDISPFFHSRHDACFHRSVALLRFLSREGHAADWVFGVRDQPFRAHCWIESAGVVLNDELDHVLDYTPILTV